MPDEQMNLEEIILDLEAIREALRIPKWAFAGHSIGGMIALQYAVLKQQTLTKCICGWVAFMDFVKKTTKTLKHV